MSNLVKTKEILAALDIDHPPLTMELMLEREAAIEERWLSQMRELEASLLHRAELMDAVTKAHVKIAEAAQSELHNKGIPIPTLLAYSQGAPPYPPPTIDESALTQVMDATAKYITMGADFETILNAIKGNDMLKGQWEKFMVMLRMVQPS